MQAENAEPSEELRWITMMLSSRADLNRPIQFFKKPKIDFM